MLKDHLIIEGTSNPNGCKATDWIGSLFDLMYLIGGVIH